MQARERAAINRMEKWAIITGASSGIGRALAFEFAGGGFHLGLVGRSQASLEEVAEQCRGPYGRDTEVIGADLSCPESVVAVVDTLTSKPRTYDVLVNNAVFGMHGDFAGSDIDQNVQLLNVQLTAALRLTKAMLP